MATLTLPVATFTRQENFAVVESKFQAGNSQVRLDHPESDVIYSVKAPNSTETEMQAYRAFYQARNGPYESFLWTPPGESSAVSVRFKGALSIDHPLGYWMISFDLVKVVL